MHTLVFFFVIRRILLPPYLRKMRANTRKVSRLISVLGDDLDESSDGLSDIMHVLNSHLKEHLSVKSQTLKLPLLSI